MSSGPTPGAIANIKFMQAVSREPDAPDLINLELVQEMAEIVDRARGRIPDEDCTVLLGIGGMLIKPAYQEIGAGLSAMLAINRAKDR
jgi:hypothetical protein